MLWDSENAPPTSHSPVPKSVVSVSGTFKDAATIALVREPGWSGTPRLAVGSPNPASKPVTADDETSTGPWCPS